MFYPLPLNKNPNKIKIGLKCLLILVAILTATSTFAQVGIGTDTPAASAALEVTSATNNKGILIPRVTATQKDAISNPAEGLMVYQTSAPAGFYYYTGAAWKLMVTQTDIDLKVTKVTGKDLSSNDYTSAEKTKVSNLSGTNTGDQDLSTLATAASVALKANTADVTTRLASKVDKVTGKDLSSNDYSTAEKTKLAAVTGSNTGDQDLSALATTASMGLKAPLASPTFTGTVTAPFFVGDGSGLTGINGGGTSSASSNDYTTAEKTKLAAITGSNTGDQDLSALATTASVALKANTTDVTTSLVLKVDKVIGKDLSSNDYTTTEKTKLAAISGSNTGDQDLSALATTASVVFKANITDVNTDLALKANTADVTNSLALKANTTDVNTDLALKANTVDVTNSLALKANITDVNTDLALKANTAELTNSLALKAPLASPTLVTPNIGVATGTSLSVSGQLTSTIVTGTAPLVVSSTTPVANLNIGGNAATATLANTVSTNANLTGDVISSGSNVTRIDAGKVTNAMLAGSIDLTSKVTGILSSSNGGTGNGFTTITGPTSSEKTFTLPDASATILTSNAAVSVAQGGTGYTTYADGELLIGNTTGNTLTKATLTQGTGISITNAGGVITIASAGGVANGTATGDMNYWNGSAWVRVPAGTNGQTLTFSNGAPTWTGTISYANTVLNPTTGKIWMDRNLGATQVATSSTDAASYGDLYQWGRGADGHQIRTSGTSASLSTTDQPGNGNFILAPNSPDDWRSGQNVNLWQGVSGINNPCPSGYRLPTEKEWTDEIASWGSGNANAAGAFASPLKLPMAGDRYSNNGTLNFVGTAGIYWSSTVSSTYSRGLGFDYSVANMFHYYQAFGFSVRCLKD